MNRIFFALFMILLGCVNISAQKPVKVKSTYTYHANRNETPADAERIALLRAQIKAIEETFGTNVSETASSIVSTQFDENFFSSYSNSSVKGEWIETIGKPIYSYEFDDRIPVITCTVEGYVKEIVGIRTDFEAKVLRNSPNLRFESIEFSDGDEMYLYFKSPAGGYLTVFLLCNEDDVALCLLPYRECKEGAFRVDADKEYFLFSKDRATVYPEWVDEYKLSTDRQIEFNDLMIIFSPERFNKLSLNVNEEDITAIKETSIGKFNKWLANLQSKNNDITLNKLTIKILNK